MTKDKMNQIKTILLLISLLIAGRNSYAQTALYPPAPKVDFSNMGKTHSDSKASYKEQLKKINERVENVRQIRASVITKWLKVHNLRRVQYLAGHRYISSTEMYKENEIDGLLEEVNQFHPLG